MSSSSKTGYGHPPVEHRFRKGQSGNPDGRPKGSRNLSTMVQAALAEKVVVNINGQRRKVSKLEAAFIQQANKAASGDAKATKLMLDVLAGAEQREAPDSSAGELTLEARRLQDALILKVLRARLDGRGDGE